MNRVASAFAVAFESTSEFKKLASLPEEEQSRVMDEFFRRTAAMLSEEQQQAIADLVKPKIQEKFSQNGFDPEVTPEVSGEPASPAASPETSPAEGLDGQQAGDESHPLSGILDEEAPVEEGHATGDPNADITDSEPEPTPGDAPMEGGPNADITGDESEPEPGVNRYEQPSPEESEGDDGMSSLEQSESYKSMAPYLEEGADFEAFLLGEHHDDPGQVGLEGPAGEGPGIYDSVDSEDPQQDVSPDPEVEEEKTAASPVPEEKEEKVSANKMVDLFQGMVGILANILQPPKKPVIVAAKGQQVNRKDKDLMADTGGPSNQPDREPEAKPPRATSRVDKGVEGNGGLLDV